MTTTSNSRTATVTPTVMNHSAWVTCTGIPPVAWTPEVSSAAWATRNTGRLAGSHRDDDVAAEEYSPPAHILAGVAADARPGVLFGVRAELEPDSARPLPF